MTEPLTRSASLTGYADLARSVGLDPHRLAAEQGLPAACLVNPDLKIPAAAVGRLLERSAGLSGSLDFGLRLAETRYLSNLGAVGFVLREQPTLRKVLDVMANYSWAQNEALRLELEDHGEIAVLRETMVGRRLFAGRQATELTLGVIARTVRRLIGKAWRPEAVSLTHSRPPDTTTHRRVFGLTPLFEQDFDGLAINSRDLEVTIAEADPVAAARALRYVEQEARLRRDDPAAMVRELILALLPTGTCTIDRVAAHLGVSRRTLHRRLAAANAPSFTHLLDEARLGMARNYLAAGRYSLTEIAERLGYGSLSAFSRWRRGRKMA